MKECEYRLVREMYDRLFENADWTGLDWTGLDSI
jgi:hypothetical protein